MYDSNAIMRRVRSSSAVNLAFVGVALLALLALPRCSATGKIDGDAFLVNETSRPLRILSVFGHAGYSHFNVFSPLMEELARRGHHVTVLSHFPRSESAKAKEPLPTYRDISLKDPTIGIYKNVMDLKQNFNIFIILIMLRKMADAACKSALLHNTAVRQLIDSNERFDVMLTEGFNTNCFLGFVHRFDVPYLYLSSHQIMPWFNDELDNPENPSFMMTLFQGYNQPMNLVSRTSNVILSSLSRMLYEWYYRPRDQAIAYKAFGPDVPNLKKLGQRAQALLVNTHFSLFGNVPQLSNVVQIGGLHISSMLNGSLPRDIAEFLDNAPEGVLYFSLGSMIKLTTMSPDKMDVILNVIDSIPRKVLWKWESEQLPRQMSNVMTKKWLPQFDVLSK